MGFFARGLTAFVLVAAGVFPAAAFDGPPPSKGAGAPAEANQKAGADQSASEASKASAATRQAYDAGIKAYQDGKTDLAIRAFSKALQGGGLVSQKMAQALYYRGLAYRKKGKPGLAISDLTSAIWLKDGLTYAERQEATAARVAAYREAGISDVPQLPSSQTALAEGAAQVPGGWQTAMADAPAASSSPSAGVPASLYAPPAQPQPQQPSSSSSSSGGGISGFFHSVTNGVTSLFGGGSSSSNAPNANDGAVSTSSLSQASNNPQPEAASWSGNTQVAVVTPPAGQVSDVATPFVTEVAKTPAAAKASKSAAKAASGKYRLQVAAVRSRTEAENVAQRLVTQHGAELGARAPVVDEAVIGSMGTFYRVRVGPYADARESQKLCSKLQADGFDCLLVTQ